MKRIRADNRLKDLPVYFLTAIPSVEVEKKIQELGATGAILKPFNLSDFDTIHKYLKSK